MSRSVSGQIAVIEYHCQKCGILHKKGDSEFDSHMQYLFKDWKEIIQPEKVIFT